MIKPLVYYQFGLYRRLWAYASIQEFKLIALAVTTASILVSIIVSLISDPHGCKRLFPQVLFIDWLLSLLAVGGLRLSFRIVSESQSTSRQGSPTTASLVVGAGDAGAMVVREMQRNPQAQSVNLLVLLMMIQPSRSMKFMAHLWLDKLDELAQVIDAEESRGSDHCHS